MGSSAGPLCACLGNNHKTKAQNISPTPTLAFFISADAVCGQKDANFGSGSYLSRDQGDVLTSSSPRKSLLMNLLQKFAFVRPRSFSVALERENCLDTRMRSTIARAPRRPKSFKTPKSPEVPQWRGEGNAFDDRTHCLTHWSLDDCSGSCSSTDASCSVHRPQLLLRLQVLRPPTSCDRQRFSRQPRMTNGSGKMGL